MIIIIVGGIGSGKSTTAVRMMKESKYHSYTNMNVRIENTTRLYKHDIIKIEIEGKKKKKVYSVNWDFWNEALKKHGNYSICLDETNNLFASRMAISRWNQKGIEFISQVRKILGDSEKSNMILVTQRLKRLDVAFRDLLHVIITCRKHQTDKIINTRVYDNGRTRIIPIPETMIECRYYYGRNAEQRYLNESNAKTWNHRSCYLANPYFNLYDTYQIFGESAYL